MIKKVTGTGERLHDQSEGGEGKNRRRRIRQYVGGMVVVEAVGVPPRSTTGSEEDTRKVLVCSELYVFGPPTYDLLGLAVSSRRPPSLPLSWPP